MVVDGKRVGPESDILSHFTTVRGSRENLQIMVSSEYTYSFSMDMLGAELALRGHILDAIDKFRASRISFTSEKLYFWKGIGRRPYAGFREETSVERLWEDTLKGMQTKPGASPAAALDQLFRSGPAVQMDCATALSLIELESVRRYLGDRAFDTYFSAGLKLSGALESTDTAADKPVGADLLLGDWVYFDNPNAALVHSDYLGENAMLIEAEPRLYFGHPRIVGTEDQILTRLNAVTRTMASGKRAGGAVLTGHVGVPETRRWLELKKKQGAGQ